MGEAPALQSRSSCGQFVGRPLRLPDLTATFIHPRNPPLGDCGKTLKRKIFDVLPFEIAALPEVFFEGPFGLRPFCFLASFRFGQVAGLLPSLRSALRAACGRLSPSGRLSSRLARTQNDSRFFIPEFFNSLLAPKWAEIFQPRATPWESVGEDSEPQGGGSNPLGKRELGPRRWRLEMGGFNSQGVALGCHRDGPLGLSLIVLQQSRKSSEIHGCA